ncbi:hypothetical protein C725_1916 [Pacificimonas flava]|uniref:Uncharacterized protein n=1 Tax=Pacificimonas flava TaxID=1234595 RepID=M2TMC3_9SPHN|nr:hypothetical protein C725_1916 [Pacificimonas flava]
MNILCENYTCRPVGSGGLERGASVVDASAGTLSGKADRKSERVSGSSSILSLKRLRERKRP